ncbi:hypothetical protein ACIGFK_34305 [Streptomyces sp. NPDC085524]|uniref:hypothetical protein n=1 Tax=unclassified Streptomyces TaxID=2593676 RepID=UPI0035D94A1F
MEGPGVTVVANGPTAFDIATCPPGQKAVSGGFRAATFVYPVASFQTSVNGPGDTWYVAFQNVNVANDFPANAIAYCSP